MSTEPVDTPRPRSTTTPRLRASDAEREEYATIIREAVGEGRLDIAEGDSRLSTIYAARYRDELAPVVTDLPAGQARSQSSRGQESSRSQAGPWGPVPWDHGRGDDWDGGRGRRFPRGRYAPGPASVFAHTGFVVVVAGALTLLWLVSATHFFWPAIPLFFLIMGLARHWRYASWRRAWRDDRA
jgi:hypothetical protein